MKPLFACQYVPTGSPSKPWKARVSHRERLEAVFSGNPPDRTPLLGGWIASPGHIMAITGVDAAAYWEDPRAVSIKAYELLGTDGLVSNLVPRSRDDFRIVDASTYARADKGETLSQTIERIDAMPEAERYESQFDFPSAYQAFRAELVRSQEACGEMVWMPAMWDAAAKVTWFFDFGYENFFSVVGLHPDRARRLIETGGAMGRCRSLLVARAVKEGLFPHAVLLGEDICSQRGPMISPRLLEKYYAPVLERGLDPLREAGCKPVWHCDGDVRPILDMLIDCGIQGLQGFQPECGLDIEKVARMRTREGRPLLVFGPLAVTTELPACTPEQIKEKVRHAIEVCRGNADLALFTSNTINPDVPLENVRAMCEAVYEGA